MKAKELSTNMHILYPISRVSINILMERNELLYVGKAKDLKKKNQ